MISRLHLSVIIAIAIGSIAIARLTAGEAVSWDRFAYIAVAIGANAFLLTAFNLRIWRWDVWQGWFVKRPHLWGDWNVTIEPQWRNLETGQQPKAIHGTFSVRQTYCAIYIRLQTSESKGDLISANIIDSGDGRYKVAGIYQNEPSLDVRDGSPIHIGALVLEVEGDPNSPVTLKGHYWTDRLTRGQITATRNH